MPDPKRLKEAAEWLRYAAEDLETAYLLADATPPRLRQALFSAQQCAEKALKAFLIYHDCTYPLTHNLTVLRDLCGERDPSVAIIAGPTLSLTEFAVRFRYPGVLPEELDAVDAREWLEATKRVYDCILERIRPE